MAIDVSAVARVMGIDTQYKNLREGSILYLPQRVAVIAQGSSDAVYSSTKYVALAAGDVGARYGYGSPAHLAMLQLQPVNGDGVGSIPVTIYPLQGAAGATAAAGDITPSGTQTQAASYRLKIGGIRSAAFTIPVGATVSHIIGAAMAAIQAVLEMPVTVAPTYGSPTSTPGTNTGNGTLSAITVTGTPRPGVYKLTATSATTFRLTDPDGVVVNASVPTNASAQSVNGLQLTLAAGATPYAIGDSFTLTVPATKLNVTSKWKGDSANRIRISLEGQTYGVTFAFTQPAGGATNPSVTDALAQFGDTWETLVLNTLTISDTTALDALQTFGNGRWLDTVRKPFVAFTGTTHATPIETTAVTGARRTDRVNSIIPSPDSEDLPLVVAARALARIARVANNNPPRDYGGQRLTGLTPGKDVSQWDYNARDFAVKNGCSTVEIKDGVVALSDVVTCYRPTGEEPPAFRFVVDLIKLQNVIFNLSLIFEGEDWDGAPLVPNDQPVANPDARKPRDAVAAANAMIDSLAINAILSDPTTAKKKTTGSINAQNPKRLDLKLVVQLSGNSNVKAIELGFGFYFGVQAAA